MGGGGGGADAMVSGTTSSIPSNPMPGGATGDNGWGIIGSGITGGGLDGEALRVMSGGAIG